MPVRPIIWMGDSKRVVRSFAKPARQEVGFELYRVQQGLYPRDWKPLPSVGPGVIEIRVHAGREYRILYVAKSQFGVCVLDAFVKKSRKTPAAAIALAIVRLKELLERF